MTFTETSYEIGDSVDLRALPPLGFKWTTVETASFHFRQGQFAGGSWSYRIEAQNEVIGASGDTVTIKSNERTTSDFRGSAVPNPDADHAKARLSILTMDRTGRVLNSEGQNPDAFKEEPFPDRPLKLGESFETDSDGAGANAGLDVRTTYTLKEVVTIKGRRVAVLHFTTSGDLDGSGTLWRDLQSGLNLETRSELSGRNATGDPTEMEGHFKITDANGEDWLD